MLVWALRNAKKYFPKLSTPEPKAKPRKEESSDTKAKNASGKGSKGKRGSK